MGLIQYRTVINHLIIMELLHRVQFTASISCPEFYFERIPQVLGNPHMEICVNQLVSNHTDDGSHKDGGCLPKRLLLFKSYRFYGRHTANLEHVHRCEPQGGPCLPTLEMRTSKLFRLQCSSKALHRKLPIIRFLDC